MKLIEVSSLICQWSFIQSDQVSYTRWNLAEYGRSGEYSLRAVVPLIGWDMMEMHQPNKIIGNPRFHLPEGYASFAPRCEVAVSTIVTQNYAQIQFRGVLPIKQVLNEKQEYER
ncbi:hypothetical protein KY290_000185 [Solanum tuberosum]|uniref:Uncharacterized protein n=1 Tax=Solanum tuberosum TaxID=4113 RepID=A0ABQ7WKY7_SOLTU|nr:hypothetical protein KY290_000185 [Solanum tuberosum]